MIVEQEVESKEKHKLKGNDQHYDKVRVNLYSLFLKVSKTEVLPVYIVRIACVSEL